MVSVASRRYRFLRSLGTLLLAFSITIPLVILDEIGSIGIFSDRTDKPHNIANAVGAALASLAILLSIASGLRSWLLASSVKLKPRIDTRSYWRVLKEFPVGALRAIRYTYTDDDRTNQKMLLYAFIAMVMAVISVIISLIKS